MLSPQLRRKVHDLWSLFWSSGLSNPLVAIEQITYLLFIRQLESLDRERVKQGKRSIYTSRGTEQRPTGAAMVDYERCRWSYVRQNPSFELLNETIFPWLRGLEEWLGKQASEGEDHLKKVTGRLSDAYFILDVNKTDTLKRAVGLIDDLFRQLDTRSVNSDIMGDIFEYLLEEVKESGKNGQFRTPRHVIRFMVQLLKPELGKTILDPACGSGGFLLNSLLQWKADCTDPEVLRLEWDGTPHDVLPVWPGGRQQNFSALFRGYDNDRTMVRIAWMNLILHDLESPEVYQLDALSKRLKDDDSGTYDYILANPPFTGSVDEGDLSENRQRFPRDGKGKAAITTKSELLFVWLMLDLLKIGGRAAVIVPDGVLFGGTKPHRALRRQLLFENTLEAVVSLPANMFQPYSGVKTSILLFQKAGAPGAKGDNPRTDKVWFYEITDEAYSLDQKRKARFGQDNDFWDALVKFEAWTSFRQGETASEAAAVSKDYHQPDYWEERWCSVDESFLHVFPEKSNEKGRTFPIHELWPSRFQFDRAGKKDLKQIEKDVVESSRTKLEEQFKWVCQQAAGAAVHPSSHNPDRVAMAAAATKAAKNLVTLINRKIREEALLDSEFDQFGKAALQPLIEEMKGRASDWASLVQAPANVAFVAEPDINRAAENLRPVLCEFAKLDGYNVWRRSLATWPRKGKLTPSDGGEPQRVPTLLSWIVPVRRWAELESWGEDPETKQPIGKPTHRNGDHDPAYVAWLRDTLKIFDDDGRVKQDFIDRLAPDCLEALDFNLSAGRHKPFVFDAGQHRPPAELIGELQAIHGEVQKRLGKLLTMVGSRVSS